MKIFWNNAISDNFTSAGDWSTAKVPGPPDTAVMTVPGTYTISSTANRTVLGINTGSNTTLTIDNNSNFTATEGTAIGANRGSVQVNAGSNFQIGGVFDNIGTIDLLATNIGGVVLNIGPTGATLTGGGTIVMSDVPPPQRFENFIQGGQITNVNNTISGAGDIGGGTFLAFINEKLGVVDATGTNSPLTIDALTTTNLGLLEATGSAGLVIYSVVNNTSGVIQAGDNSLVSLFGSIEGGTLKTIGNGVLAVPSGVNLTGRINIDGAIDVGTPTQAASIGTGSSPKSSPLNLTGHGSIVLSDNGGNSIIAPSDLGLQYLNNAVLISGAGVIGGGNLNLKNQTTGLIEATGINPLIIDTGQNAVSNFGTLEASTGSTLFVVSKLANNGTLQAVDGLVAVQGTVSGTGGGTINGTGQMEFGAASNNRVRFAAGSTGELILDDSKQYVGTIFGFGANTTQSIDLADINFATVKKSYAPASPNTNGTLTIKDGAGDVAHIKFSGTYTLANFNLSDDGNGGVLITDPKVKGSSSLNSNVISLLGNYIASVFAAGDHSSLIFPAIDTVSHPSIAVPHA